MFSESHKKDTIICIWVIAKGIAVLDVARYMPEKEFDFIFFSGLHRYFSEAKSFNQELKIVSIHELVNNIEKDKSYTVCYIEGHGPETGGELGLVNKFSMSTKDIKKVFNVFGDNSSNASKLNQIKSIIFTSCFSTKKVLSRLSISKPESLVSGVQDILKSIQSSHHSVVTSIPTVQGLDGGALIHPSPLCPIVQVKPNMHGGSTEMLNDDCFALQEFLTKHMFSTEISNAKNHFSKMLDAFEHGVVTGGTKKLKLLTSIEKFTMLKDTASLIAKETEPFFDMYIKLAYMCNYLLEKCFIFGGIGGAVSKKLSPSKVDLKLKGRIDCVIDHMLGKKTEFKFTSNTTAYMNEWKNIMRTLPLIQLLPQLKKECLVLKK